MENSDASICIERVLDHWFHHYSDNLPEIYLVGGATRDLMMSREPKDIDLVCRDAATLAFRLVRGRNAVVVRMEKKADEPCYRLVDRDCPEMEMDIAELRGGSIHEDLSRRDFTINATAIALRDARHLGEMIDPFHGALDLAEGILRTTQSHSLVSDPLRILRAIRFAAWLGLEIESRTLEAMRRHAPLLETVSTERIMSELLQILQFPHGVPFFQLMDRLGVLGVIFPEIESMKGCTQSPSSGGDVWGHCMEVMHNCEHIFQHLPEIFEACSDAVLKILKEGNRLALLKLASLFHDVGKPSTRHIDPQTGRVTFHDHDRTGAKLVEAMGLRLKMSGRNREFLRLMVAEHLRVLDLWNVPLKPGASLRWFRDLRDDAIPVILLGMADSVVGIPGPASDKELQTGYLEWSKRIVTEYFGEMKAKLEPQKLITGKDLVELGMKPGPNMGRTLQRIQHAQDCGEIHDRESALELVRRLLPSRGD